MANPNKPYNRAEFPLDCPWCGEAEEAMRHASGLSDPNAALEAHAEECVHFLAEAAGNAP